jgi:hypothetical protein
MSEAWDLDPKYMMKIPHDDLIAKGYTYLGRGRHRQTYLLPSGKHVIKFPINDEGVGANQREYRKFKNTKHEGIFARCRLINVDDSACIIMVAVKPLENKYCNFDLPYWVDEIDNMQVGFTRRQQLVCYDYGDGMYTPGD